MRKTGCLSGRGSSYLLSFLLLIPLVVGCEGRGIRSITSKELKDHVYYLASDELAGRMTGEAGTRVAEEYIAEHFEDFGLSPLPGEDDLFLDFDLFEYGYDPEETYLEAQVDGIVHRARPGIDFKPFFFTDTGRVEAEVVFAGYGITASEHNYDDYEGLDVSGKIVFLLRHEPGKKDPESPFYGSEYSSHAYFLTKARNAVRHGAVGMILVTDPNFIGAKEPAGVDDFRLFGEMRLEAAGPSKPRGTTTVESLLALHISQEIGEALVAPSGWTLKSLQDAVDGGSKPVELNVAGLSAKMGIEKRAEAKQIAARNVAGFLEGRDPDFKDEWIVVGSHHDHIGGYDGEGDTIFNGADDNASGTSGVLELAEAFARREIRPKRSIVFVTFGAEEEGLLGSRAFVEQRQGPIERIVYMLNFDMIGRNPERNLLVFSSSSANDLKEMVEKAGEELEVGVGFLGASQEAASDFIPFNNIGIPYLFFFTGLHDDYHQVGDHAAKLSYPRMEGIVRLAYKVLDRLADEDRKN